MHCFFCETNICTNKPTYVIIDNLVCVTCRLCYAFYRDDLEEYKVPERGNATMLAFIDKNKL